MRRGFVLALLSLLLLGLVHSPVLGQPVNPRSLLLGSALQGQLTQDTTVQWYSVTLNEPGQLSIRAEAQDNLTMALRLFDANGTTALHSDTSGTASVRVVGHSHFNPGTYFVSVQRTGGSGGYSVHADYQRKTQPGDAAPGNSRNQPHTLNFAQPISGLLGFYHGGRTDSEAWFAVTTSEPGLLRVEIKADESLSIAAQLFDTNGTTSLQNNASGTTSTRILEHSHLNPGTYYIQVRRASGYGRYAVMPSVEIRSTAADAVPGNSREEAYLFSLTEQRTGLLGFSSGGRTDAEAWFQIAIDEPGHLRVFVEAEDNLKLAAQLFDVNRTTSLHNDASGTASERTIEQKNLNPGTYYIHVRRAAGFGRYQVSAALHRASGTSDVSPDNDRQNPYRLDYGTSRTGLLGFYSGGRTDATAWFQVYVTEPGELQVRVEAEEDLKIAAQLFDTNGTTSLQNDASGTQSLRAVSQGNLNPGTYFIQVRRASGFGRYSIEPVLITAGTAQDRIPDNSRETVHPLQLFHRATGLLGFYSGACTDSTAWYNLEITEPGAIRVLVQASGTLTIAAQLFDVNGTTSLQNDASGTSESRVLEYSNLNPGTYWIQVRRASGYGRYTVDTAFLMHPRHSGRRPAPDLSSAPELYPDDTAAGMLGFYSGGVTEARSWYKVLAHQPGPLLIHTVAEETLRIAGRLQLDGRNIASDVSGTQSSRLVSVEQATPGSYSWELTRASGHGSYHIAVSRASSGFLANPAGFDFGYAEVGSSSSAMNFALINLDFAEQAGMRVQLLGRDLGGFRLLNDEISNSTISGRSSKVVQVEFQPTSGGQKQVELSIQTPQRTLSVPLTGTGYLYIDDPILQTGTSPTAARDAAPAPDTATPPFATPTDIPVQAPEPSVPRDDPAVTGGENGLSVTPLQHNFGTVAVGQNSKTLTVLLTNSRPDSIMVWELHWRGRAGSSFALTGPEVYELDLPSNSSLPLHIAFAPKETGVQWALLEIYTDSGMFHVPVQGVGE